METVNCPKCNQVIATTEETCPACKVNIAAFMDKIKDVEAANEYLRRKQAPNSTTSQPIVKPSKWRKFSTFLKG